LPAAVREAKGHSGSIWVFMAGRKYYFSIKMAISQYVTMEISAGTQC
jgi:hypothetical protein